MADEYISRETAVKIAEKYGLANGSVLGRHTGLADCIASEISALPAADVAEVVHGRKIEDGDIGCFWLCSLCGECLPYGANYCPNCGAKMDGGYER